MTADNTGHTEECGYYETGDIEDCDCKESQKGLATPVDPPRPKGGLKQWA